MPVDRAHGKFLAHHKRDVCRVPEQKTHGKDLAHGKEALFDVCLTFDTRQKFYTRQRSTICHVPNFLHTAKLLHTAIFFKKVDSALPIFSAIHIQYIVLLVKFWYIYLFLLYLVI